MAEGVCMDEAEKLEIIKQKIAPTADDIIRGFDSIFDDSVIEQTEIIRREHDKIPREVLLKPFTI